MAIEDSKPAKRGGTQIPVEPLPTYQKLEKTVAHQLRSGEKLCPDFRAGSCTMDKGFPKGRHMCAVIMNATKIRICGRNNHGAA